jgi:phosphatidylglycerophosphate synthase
MQSSLRPGYNRFIMPLGKASAKLGFSADSWTIISLFLSIASGFMLARGQFWWGLIMALAMFAADVMDGATARAKGITNSFGMIFDHVVDRYAEFAIVGGLLVGGWISSLAGIFAISGMVMASYVRAKAESTGDVKKCDIGITGRIEKLILIYGSIILLGLGLGRFAEYMFWVLGVVSHITVIQRIVYARKVIYSGQGEKSV